MLCITRRMCIVVLFVVLILFYMVLAGSLGEYKASPRFTSLSLGPCIVLGEDELCSMNHVQYYLFTRSNPSDPELVDAIPGHSNVSESTFNPAHPTKIIIHGYNSDITLDGLVEIKDAYLSSNDYNVFMVEWGTLGPAPCYPTAAHNARYVGRCTAELVHAVAAATNKQRKDESGQLPQDLHVIGFSLGAQVAGFIANKLIPLQMPRITGLDPAMPLFLTPSSERKLDPSDAKFVDVIHTNALLQGQLQATGHIDFYMNGGFKQPGCALRSNPSACSHHRAPSYFAESIVSELGFWGWPCASWFSYFVGSCVRQKPDQIMGDFTMPTARGVFYVDTDSTPPFALGRFYNP